MGFSLSMSSKNFTMARGIKRASSLNGSVTAATLVSVLLKCLPIHKTAPSFTAATAKINHLLINKPKYVLFKYKYITS
jgi:hypothetical protein